MIYVLPIYLLSVIHEIQTASDENPPANVRGFFSDISKAFDKVWYDGIIFILKVLKMSNFCYSKTLLKIEKKRVVLNTQTSEWRRTMSGVPQGSVLGSCLFSIYINYLLYGINSFCKRFADDTSIFSKVYDIIKSVSEFHIHLSNLTIIISRCPNQKHLGIVLH